VELLFKLLHCCAIFVTLNVVKHLKYNDLTFESYNYYTFAANNLLRGLALPCAGRKPLCVMVARSWKRTKLASEATRLTHKEV